MDLLVWHSVKRSEPPISENQDSQFLRNWNSHSKYPHCPAVDIHSVSEVVEFASHVGGKRPEASFVGRVHTNFTGLRKHYTSLLYGFSTNTVRQRTTGYHLAPRIGAKKGGIVFATFSLQSDSYLNDRKIRQYKSGFSRIHRSLFQNRTRPRGFTH